MSSVNENANRRLSRLRWFDISPSEGRMKLHDQSSQCTGNHWSRLRIPRGATSAGHLPAIGMSGSICARAVRLAGQVFGRCTCEKCGPSDRRSLEPGPAAEPVILQLAGALEEATALAGTSTAAAAVKDDVIRRESRRGDPDDGALLERAVRVVGPQEERSAASSI